ncbi:MAG: hypothetical protein GY723_13910 [bacterium]|nr:hypothetical protein [bacterium]
MFPLNGGNGRSPAYITLDEAVASGTIEIRELNEAGSVPQLKVTNSGDCAVFMLDGEELQGAKQNRVLNLTILVPAGRTLVIPVSCVEQGRWRKESEAMECSGDALYAAARMAKIGAVSRAYRKTRKPTSDQGELWRLIALKARKMRVGSATGAMSDIYKKRSDRLSAYQQAFAVSDGQVGALFAIGDRVCGLELFEHPQILSKLLPKVVRSYALDAIEDEDIERPPSLEDARKLIGSLENGKVTCFPSVGAGEDVRIQGEKVEGAALVTEGRVVHLCGFGA